MYILIFLYLETKTNFSCRLHSAFKILRQNFYKFNEVSEKSEKEQIKSVPELDFENTNKFFFIGKKFY